LIAIISCEPMQMSLVIAGTVDSKMSSAALS